MATNIDKPVGPGTFTRDSYSVTIAEDGKILVRKEDWLSKYSWALYGDYNTLHVFVRPNPAITFPTQEIRGIKEIEDVDLIKTGEYLIHEPTYFHWMEKRGKPPTPRIPKPSQPPKPEDIRTKHWMAAHLGELGGTYLVGTAGAILLAFLNLDTGKTYYYVLPRMGGGAGLDFGGMVKAIRNGVRALGKPLFTKKASLARFVPVNALIEFSVRSVQGLDINCWGWQVSTGAPNQNKSYEKITGYTSTLEHFNVVFQETKWITLPGGSANFTGGALIWVW